MSAAAVALTVAPAATVREARPEDVPALAAIVRHYITTSAALWVLEPPTDEEYRVAFDASRAAGYPILVASEASTDSVVGYASAGTFRARYATA
jgi:L-amino acid N-acyltransferase YncA